MHHVEGHLGRLEPVDFKHVEKYPITALGDEAPTGVPVVGGFNWYSGFDSPILKGGRYWIGLGDLGRIRGGHAVCTPSQHQSDRTAWWDFYNQGQEGACVGFASSRMMSLLNRVRYDARWLYKQAQQVDPWPGDDYSGTSVSAAMDILRTVGHSRLYRGKTRSQDLQQGIVANRWATTVDEVRAVLASPLHDKLEAFPILNSWGRSYPRVVWMPYPVYGRLLDEYGEVALVTDR